MNNTKRICYLSVLSALYVVLSAFLKINLIGNIQVDLGYIAFAVAIYFFGIYGAFVGVIGCSLESILFSAYGFSVSWMIANLIIGIGCGIVFSKTNDTTVRHRVYRMLSIIIFSLIGLLVAKTIIECSLYGIPYLVKIPKNAIAFAIDTATMLLGVYLAKRVNGWGVVGE